MVTEKRNQIPSKKKEPCFDEYRQKYTLENTISTETEIFAQVTTRTVNLSSSIKTESQVRKVAWFDAYRC